MELVYNLSLMVLGILTAFLAVYLWALSRRFSTAVLGITALLLYALTALKLLHNYGLLGDVSFRGSDLIIESILLILVIVSFIISLLVSLREERKSQNG
jgi:cellobiose-specific phosphotransferase system component IIC